jgi:hypothetical protein
MKKIQMLIFVLVAVFAGSAFAVSSAFAGSEFLVSGAVITAPVEVNGESVGAMLFEDAATLGGASDFLCEEILTLGFVGETFGGIFNAKQDLISSIEFMKPCIIGSGPCESVDSVAMINLPWLTEIVLSGTSFIDLILGDEAGVPGYLFECTTVLGLIDDTCATEAMTTTIMNETEDIDATFPLASEAERTSCTQGNAKSGVVAGTSLILTESGLSLAVS